MFATLDDLEGSVEILVFGKALAEYEGALGVDSVVVVRGRVDHKDADKTCLVVQSAEPFAPTPEEVEQRAGERPRRARSGPLPLHVRVDAAGLPASAISDLKHLLANFPGESEVVLEFQLRSGDPLTLKLGPSYQVAPTPTLRAELEHVLGPGRAHRRLTARSAAAVALGQRGASVARRARRRDRMLAGLLVTPAGVLSTSPTPTKTAREHRDRSSADRDRRVGQQQATAPSASSGTASMTSHCQNGDAAAAGEVVGLSNVHAPRVPAARASLAPARGVLRGAPPAPRSRAAQRRASAISSRVGPLCRRARGLEHARQAFEARLGQEHRAAVRADLALADVRVAVAVRARAASASR